MAITKATVKADLARQQRVYDDHEKENAEIRTLAKERRNSPSVPAGDFLVKMRSHLKSLKRVK